MHNTSSFSSSWSSRPLQLLLCHEDSLGTRLPLSLLYLLLAISGTLSNFMVIYMVFTSRKLRITSNAFIVNGCIADLSVCGFWMPQEAMQGLLPSGFPIAHSESYQLLRISLVTLGLFVSLLSHLLVALNRYVLITKPHIIYQAVYQQKHTTWMICLTWISALLLAIVPPGLETWRPIQQESKNATSSKSSNYAGLGGALAILSQTVLLLHCYMRIVKRVQGSVKRISTLDFHLLQQLPFLNTTGQAPRRAQRHLSSISVLLLCLIFLLATQPLMWVNLLSFFFRPAPRGLQLSCWLLFCSLSAFNPLLYTWKNEEFRRCLRLILHGRESTTVAIAAAEASATLPTVSPPTQGPLQVLKHKELKTSVITKENLQHTLMKEY